MVDTERMKRVLDRLLPGWPDPPPPPPPVFPGPLPGPGGPRPPEAPSCSEWYRRENELEAILREIGRRSRFLSGQMSRFRTASRRRQTALRRFCGPERPPTPPMAPEWGREGVYRMLRRAENLTGDLERDYLRASGRGGLPSWLSGSAGETRRALERLLRRIGG